jgi:pimeloyl-ACP methyl ester carboxylesterase
MEDQARAFKTQVPHARIVRIANAGHYIFQSKADEVVSEMNAFLASSQGKRPANVKSLGRSTQ